MDLHVSLVDRKNLTEEIYRQIRGAIVEGRLRPGDSLPPSRELARRLSVSRTTAMVAYDRLNGEGFVTSRAGAGTFVSEHLPSGVDQPARATGELRPRPVWSTIETLTPFSAPAAFDFRAGLPDTSLFPYQTWRRLMARELHADGTAGRPYDDPAGHQGLRDAIARHVGTARGVTATAADVLVTTGTQQALDLVARVLVAPGDLVATERPGYAPPNLLYQSLGLRVARVPVDAEGLVVDALPRTARLVYVTPSHQFPLGTAMSLRRRLALLAWVQRHDAAIVEDDYDSEFRFGGRPIEPLRTLDTHGRVIYLGSFSKTMLPTLRLGFVIAPAALREALRSAKFVTDWHTALPTQAALASFIDQGWLARHVRKMRAVYGARHERIVRWLDGELAPHLTTIPSAAGLHVSAETTRLGRDGVAAVVEQAQARGVAVQRLVFGDDQPDRSGLMLSYGAVAEHDIDEGLRRLLACFEAVDGAGAVARAVGQG